MSTLVVGPKPAELATERSVALLALGDGGYQRVERSGLIELGAAELTDRLVWP